MSGAKGFGCEVFHIGHRAAGTERARPPGLDASAEAAGEGEDDRGRCCRGKIRGSARRDFDFLCGRSPSVLGAGSCLALTSAFQARKEGGGSRKCEWAGSEGLKSEPEAASGGRRCTACKSEGRDESFDHRVGLIWHLDVGEVSRTHDLAEAHVAKNLAKSALVGSAADRKFKRPLLRLRRFSVSHSGDVGSGLAPVGGVAAAEPATPAKAAKTSASSPL